jgi:hypothetical protein
MLCSEESDWDENTIFSAAKNAVENMAWTQSSFLHKLSFPPEHKFPFNTGKVTRHCCTRFAFFRNLGNFFFSRHSFHPSLCPLMRSWDVDYPLKACMFKGPLLCKEERRM